MGMTMTQKILAAHAGLDSVEAGQLIEAKLDIVMANDITGPMALPILKQMSDTVFDKDKVVFVPDHFTPNKDIKSAENSKAIREFSKAQGLKWYFEQGKSGVEHAILPEAGVVTAGECIIGADSHTCTYGALGAFSTGMGTTDVATGMATGEIWFKVPSAIRFVLTGKPNMSAEKILLSISSVRSEWMELFTNQWNLPETELPVFRWMTVLRWQIWRSRLVQRTGSSRLMKRQRLILQNIARKNIQFMRLMRTQYMMM